MAAAKRAQPAYPIWLVFSARYSGPVLRSASSVAGREGGVDAKASNAPEAELATLRGSPGLTVGETSSAKRLSAITCGGGISPNRLPLYLRRGPRPRRLLL